MGIFVSRRTQCGAVSFLVLVATFMVGMVIGQRYYRVDNPEEILRVYVRLAWLSKSLQKMDVDARELDEVIRNNWMTTRIEDRIKLNEELNDIVRGYYDAARKYNRAMYETGYRFVDPAKLPPGAQFGPLPREFPLFILLSGSRV